MEESCLNATKQARKKGANEGNVVEKLLYGSDELGDDVEVTLLVGARACETPKELEKSLEEVREVRGGVGGERDGGSVDSVGRTRRGGGGSGEARGRVRKGGGRSGRARGGGGRA